jgi:hypothetical protein
MRPATSKKVGGIGVLFFIWFWLRLNNGTNIIGYFDSAKKNKKYFFTATGYRLPGHHDQNRSTGPPRPATTTGPPGSKTLPVLTIDD